MSVKRKLPLVLALARGEAQAVVEADVMVVEFAISVVAIVPSVIKTKSRNASF